MIIKPAQRTLSVQEYYFSRKLKEIDRLNIQRQAACEPRIINLGIGSPDGFPPSEAVEELSAWARKSDSHGYQSYVGTPALRRAFCDWYKRYYGVELDSDREVQPLVGSKEGILLISLAFLDKGDKVLVPDPGYPTYTSASRMVEAEILRYDLLEENGWYPDFEALEKMDLEGVKIMWVNYPHMPTGASATSELYARIVDFGRRHGILIVNDNPYSFILNDKPLSILSVPGAKDCCLELNSLSKAHNMAGWRMGMVAGDGEIISEVLKVKSQMDSGMFKPLQMAAVKALSSGPEWFEGVNAEYRRRRVVAEEIFRTIGARFDPSAAGLFLWGRISADNPLLGDANPELKCLAERISDRLLYEAGVFITPGLIFGRNGEEYVRISLCAPEQTLSEALDRIKKSIIK